MTHKTTWRDRTVKTSPPSTLFANDFLTRGAMSEQLGDTVAMPFGWTPRLLKSEDAESVTKGDEH